MSLIDLQNTLFYTKLEVQKLKRAQGQKEHQLAEAKRATQLLETMMHEEEQQKEATWKHNQVLHSHSPFLPTPAWGYWCARERSSVSLASYLRI